MKHSQRITAFALIPILLVALTACPAASKVNLYVGLAVNAVNGGLALAKTFGVQISDSTTAKVSSLGTDLENAVTAWAGASAAQKPGQWAAVQTALDAFKTYLPAALNDAGVPAQYAAYAGIVSLAITAVEAAVNIVEALHAPAGTVKAAAPLNVGQYKKNYNQQMVTAGHPELQLK